jgi:hypothetical protein
MEERNKPSAVLVNEYFLNDALSAASQKGMPGMRIIPEIVPCESMVDTQIEAGVSAALDNIITALTRPLTEEDKSPKAREAYSTSKIIFKGDLKEVNQFFYKRGWTDGFPVIPPTEEEVAEMLTGTDLPSDHIVSKIIPRLGKATIEKIAINAVMAGALPTYMPILIAGVQAVMDPDSNFAAWGFSAGSWSPFWIINGPIRKDLNINCGSGVLSPGDIANATIGRAMGLIIKNIGGIRKGIEDMGSLGNPGKYTMVVGENEERSPWEPLHVTFGFKREDSTLALSFPNIYWQMLPSDSDEKSVLSAAVHDIGFAGKGGYYLILSPAAAGFLADAGWKKKDVMDIIQKVTAPTGMPAKAPPAEKRSYSKSVLSGAASFVQIVVTGGATNAMGFAKGFGVGRVIKKIELPAHWDKLVQKYKNIVPTYSRY